MEQPAIAGGGVTRIPRLILAAGVWLFAYFLARYGMHAWAPAAPWDIVVASMPLVTFFWLVYEVQRILRHIDELQRRIHLEALAMAFLIVMLALMGLGLLEETPRGRVTLPFRDLWFALLPLYAVCWLAARRHYR
jgi:hypothetical protein